MFGKRFAYEYAGYGEEQRTPPWLRHRWSHRPDARRGQGSYGPSEMNGEAGRLHG